MVSRGKNLALKERQILTSNVFRRTISFLNAKFWYDFLNKLVNLRTRKKLRTCTLFTLWCLNLGKLQVLFDVNKPNKNVWKNYFCLRNAKKDYFRSEVEPRLPPTSTMESFATGVSGLAINNCCKAVHLKCLLWYVWSWLHVYRYTCKVKI